MTNAGGIGIGRLATLSLAALLAASTSGSGQDVAHGDSATIAATGHGRVELDVRRGAVGNTGRGGMRIALDARVAARVGMAAGAATTAIVLGAGGLASRRRAQRRDGDTGRGGEGAP